MYDDVEDEDEDDEEDHDDDDDDNDDQHIQSSNNFLWVGSSIVNSPSTGLMMTPENCDLKKNMKSQPCRTKNLQWLTSSWFSGHVDCQTYPEVR